ncbi:hypothetical protein PVAP13_1KG164200 [Panicum virgatum]|uniref:Uncharacterized protein n=1 Tax=Panicum virgatum TaxID=38727 RepID=A0A8T0XD07_PANVG|nr:hypothetical protein PVAP13_1KG164200 [Panicum virgatum]
MEVLHARLEERQRRWIRIGVRARLPWPPGGGAAAQLPWPPGSSAAADQGQGTAVHIGARSRLPLTARRPRDRCKPVDPVALEAAQDLGVPGGDGAGRPRPSEQRKYSNANECKGREVLVISLCTGERTVGGFCVKIQGTIG